jgi:cell filamentation protein, protein adenylyltransferase
MGDLERFLHADMPEIPVLVKAGLAHVQFKTVYPFPDGNGRLGRLLITLFLCERGVLREPLLYLSLYFKAHRNAYYEHLQAVRETGDWERWLDFFLTGVIETSTQATDAARRILAMFEADRRAIEALGRPASSALRIHQLLQTKPLVTIPQAAQGSGCPGRPSPARSPISNRPASSARRPAAREAGRSSTTAIRAAK